VVTLEGKIELFPVVSQGCRPVGKPWVITDCERNLIKKLVGLAIFQTSVYLLYIAPGKLIGGTAPIVSSEFQVYSNPLPHVLILTAIVVGVATLALGLALVVRLKEAYGSIEEDEILAQDRDA